MGHRAVAEEAWPVFAPQRHAQKKKGLEMNFQPLLRVQKQTTSRDLPRLLQDQLGSLIAGNVQSTERFSCGGADLDIAFMRDLMYQIVNLRTAEMIT